MPRKHVSRVVLGAIVAAATIGASRPAAAQGLIWKLPTEAGAFTRYEGTYEQTRFLPNSPQGQLVTEWLFELTIRSLEAETVDVDGKEMPARWIELKTVTGYKSAQGIDPGPFGTRIYKVLVRDDQVLGRMRDADDLPVTFLPIVKGYRKIGNRNVEPLKEKVLSVYPLVAMTGEYPSLKADAGGPQLMPDSGTLSGISATPHHGAATLETPTSRTASKCALALSSEMPFGWYSLSSEIVRDEKDATKPRTDFRQASIVKLTCTAVENGTGAQAEIQEK